MWLDVNGTRRQNGSTQDDDLQARVPGDYLSQFMSLHPGDVITTGTPPGVGMGIKPEPDLPRMSATSWSSASRSSAASARSSRRRNGAGGTCGAPRPMPRHRIVHSHDLREHRAAAHPRALVRLHRSRLLRRAHLGAQSRRSARASRCASASWSTYRNSRAGDHRARRAVGHARRAGAHRAHRLLPSRRRDPGRARGAGGRRAVTA